MPGKASIKVNCKRISNWHINPYIFGNFVEDIRDHMDAMLAYLLKNMDFEQCDDNGDGVSGCWFPVSNGMNTRFDLEPAAPLHSGHSQRIRLTSTDNCYAGIGQRVSVKGGIKYRIRIYARTTLEISDVSLEIVKVGTGEVLGSAVVITDSHQWKEYHADIYISRDCNNAEFRIMTNTKGKEWADHMTKGNLWLDHVSILPEQSVGNIKEKVFNMSRDLNCRMMRIGGNEISCYHWREAVGSDYLRPNRISEAWGHWTNKYFGTDEFINFCHGLAVEPLICVNAGTGTPEEAAQWVEYCNGSIDTPMGALRSQNGHPEPYHVKYWEIGNEIWGSWQSGHCTAEEFGIRIVEFYKAMKKADKEIVLLGCGHIDPEWSKTVLEIAGEYIDCLTLHIYHSYRHIGIKDDAPRGERFKGIVCYPEVTRARINMIQDIIDSSPKYNHVKLAITEYNTMYFPSTIRKGLPNEHTLEAAVANAANLNEFIRNGDKIVIGSFSDLVNGWLGGCIRVGDSYSDQSRGRVDGRSGKSLAVYGTPTYYVLKIYANQDIDYVIESEVKCDTFNVPVGETELFQKELSLCNLPELDVVSCINQEKSKVTIFIVNRSMKNIDTVIMLDNFGINSNIKVCELSGDDIDDINNVFNPECIVPLQQEIDTAPGEIQIKIKEHSIYVIECKGHIF